MDTKSIKNLIGYKISAIDGEIGKVTDFYFDCKTWTVRYLIVETGSLFFKRPVIITMQALIPSDRKDEHFLTNMSIHEIEEGPKIAEGLHLTREEEVQLHKHYHWKNYWDTDFQHLPIQTSNHLHATNEVAHYRLMGNDGEVGKIKDFLVDENWKINFIVIDAFITPPAKEIILPSEWVKKVSAEQAMIISDRTIKGIKNNPIYYPDKINI